MSLRLRCCLFAFVLLAAPPAFAQNRGVVTTEPDPVELAQFPSNNPPPPAVPLIPIAPGTTQSPQPNAPPPSPMPENLLPVPNGQAPALPQTGPVPLGPPLPGPAPIGPPPTGPAPPGPPPVPLYGPGSEGPPPPFTLWPDELTDPNRRIRFDFLEFDLLMPYIHQNLNQVLNVGGLYNTNATLPVNDLGFISPLAMQLAYTLPNLGEIDVAYRLLTSENDGVLQNFDPFGPADIRSRLDMNVVDVGVTSIGSGPWRDLLWRFQKTDGPPLWTLNWDLQTRFASIYFDSEAVGPTLDRHIVNYFYGAGPRWGLALSRMFPTSRVAIFGSANAGVIFG